MSIDEEEDFTILPNFLNDNSSLKKKKDLYRLPEWMSSLAKRFDSGQIQAETTIPLDQIDYLDEDLRSILINDLSIQHLFPVQSQVIPYLIKQNLSHSPIPPADICVSSPTGSGKTLTYVIPLIQCIRHRVTCAIRIVILLPVQDLAEQVYHVVNQLGNKLQLKTALLAGQHSFEDEQKILVKQQLNGNWTSSIDIIVCTPGRLVEHISRTIGFSLKHLRYLVIDEADRIIDEFKQDWLNILDNAVGISSQIKNDFQPYMLSQLSSNHKFYQKLLFSATLTHNPEILQQLNLFHPILFSSLSTTSSIIMPSTLRENFVVCSITYKPLIVAYLIKNQLHSEKIMIFVHSKKDVDRLSSLLKLILQDKIQVSHITRNLASNKIQTRLNMFQNGQIQILVCSDVLARGIDIPNIDCVILYDLPKNIRTYTHRIGRTARAGKIGRSITIVEKERLQMFRSTIKSHRRNKLKYMDIKKEDFSSMLTDYQNALELFSNATKSYDPCSGCEIPCEKHAPFPLEISKDIDQGKMIGSVDKHRRHLCIGQSIPTSQWPKDVKDLEGNYIAELSRVLKEKKESIGYAVKLTSASIVTTTTTDDPAHTADWYLFPDQIKIKNVNIKQIEQVIQTLFVDDQSVIKIKDKTKTIDEQLKESNNLPTFDDNIHCERLHGTWLLVCCHYQRDIRCGVIGPMLVDEIEKYIRGKDLSDNVHWLKISHIGGHKFAGNVIVYPSGTWYGRITTCHIPLLIDAYASSEEEAKTKLQPLFRGHLDTAW
ncbi:unnamed protein product [Adineta steineri]|uniref:ATP-dependent RNA helicase n=1 Tax=Adineta steineri TaxID=433720 RepID=A0A818Y9D0_9BILA|nr:unnamed protein product [Adineta steineri]